MATSAARPRFLTPAEVADQLRVSAMTVYRLIKSGELRAARIGKSYRVLEERRRRVPRGPLQRRRVTVPGGPAPTGRHYRRPGDGSPVRHDHLPLRLRHRRRVRRRRPLGDPVDRAARHRDRPHPRDPRLRRAGRVAHARARRAVPLPRRRARGRRPGRRRPAPRAWPSRSADGQSYLVGPDNGLLAERGRDVRRGHRRGRARQPRVPAARPRAHVRRARRLRPGRRPPLPRRAARTSSAPPSTRSRLLPGLLPLTREEDGALVAEVLWVDRFGNCQLNVDPDEVAHLGAARAAALGRRRPHGPARSTTYEGIDPGQVGLVVDSYGMLSVCLGKRSAAAELRMPVGTEVTLAGPRRRRRAPAHPVPARHPHPPEPHHEARHHARARDPARR